VRHWKSAAELRYDPVIMSSFFRPVRVIAFTSVIVITAATLVAQGPPPPGAQGARRRLDPPTPPAVQAGHPSGKLVIWGDLADFTRPGPVLRCYATSRFKRGQRAGFRMTAVDGGTGEIENSTEMVVHVTHAGKTFDLPMRWRGNQSYPADEYLKAPVMMWTGVWEVPMDAALGTVHYTVTAKDKFGRTATFEPFPNHLSQLAIVE
jgi:hypothetical protein